MACRVRVVRRARRVVATAGAQRWTLPAQPPDGAQAAATRMAALCVGRDDLDQPGVALDDLIATLTGDRRVAAEWARLGRATALRLVRGLVDAYGLSWGADTQWR